MQTTTQAAAVPLEKKADYPTPRPMTDAELRLAQALREKSWFKEKYLNSLRTATLTHMKKWLREQPGIAFKDLLASLLGEMPPEAPPQLLLIMTRFIIEEWDKTETVAA